MTFRTIIVLAVFVLVCGFIAYFGDLLGRRMGKRRLTLFGLRPKYTAVFVTVITGMLIAIFTITVMALASENVRMLLIKGDTIISNLNRLREDYQNVSNSYQRAVENLQRQQQISEDATREAERAKQQSRILTIEMQRVKKSLAALKEELRKNQLALKTAESKLHETNAELESSRKELLARKHEIELQRLEIERLESLKDRLAERLDEEVIPRLIALRERRIIFRPGEEIARKVIERSKSKAAIRKDIEELLAEADQKARERGAAVVNGSSIRILPKSVEDSNGKIRFLQDRQTINALVDNISNGVGSVVVLLVSVGNSLEGEQALVEFMPPFRNNLIYNKGDLVSSTIIDSRKSRGDILGDLISFLRLKVRGEAMKRGIIPQYDEEGQPMVGQIDDWDKIFDLIDKIKASGGDVVVGAYAATDTWSAGPLLLDFKVEGEL